MKKIIENRVVISIDDDAFAKLVALKVINSNTYFVEGSLRKSYIEARNIIDSYNLRNDDRPQEARIGFWRRQLRRIRAFLHV